MSTVINVKKTVIPLLLTLFLLNFLPLTSHAGSWNGWIYQNPYPTSNTLLAVKFITPKKGWIAGEHGTILYTEDGGESWEAQESGTEQNLMSIAFINDKIGWAVGERGIIIHTEDGGKAWVAQAETQIILKKIFFSNDKQGWIAGIEKSTKDTGIKGEILRTTDGGKKWEKQNIGTKRSIASIYFINSLTGWLLSGDEVYRTKDGGKNWEKSKLPVQLPKFGPPGAMRMLKEENPFDSGWGDVFFVDDKTGWAVVGFGFIFHTNDGGKTWVNQLHTDSMSYGLSQISFSDPKSGCATGSSIFCTDNGGKTWNEKLGVPPGSRKRIDDFRVQLHGISFFDRSIGWTAGNDGLIMKTEDGGRSWKIAARRDECGGNTFFIDKKTGWLYGRVPSHSTVICRTDDGGYNWEKQEVGIKVAGVFFVDHLTGWAAGKIEEGKDIKKPDKIYGVIRHTTDGGKTWTTQFKELMGKKITEDGLFRIYFVNHNMGWAVGDKGTILHSEDGGNHWEYQKKEMPDLYLRDICFLNSKVGWVIGTSVSEGWTGFILYTEDGGKYWKIQKRKKHAAMKDIFL